MSTVSLPGKARLHKAGVKDMIVDPVRIVPQLVERVWGRTDLSAWYDGAPQPGAAPLGEAWLTDVECEIEGGGTFGDLIGRDREWALGDAAGSAPILVKLLFTAQALSVQVHPTDAAARSGGIAASGKNEAWYILEAVPDATVWVGFTAPVTSIQLRAAAADGSILGLMRRHLVQAGDTVPVPAGTVHAIGAGLVLLEVQDPVQVTYRLFDYDRPRPLQVEEALAVADLGPTREPRPEAGPVAPFIRGRLLARAPRFALEQHAVRDGLVVQPDGVRSHILVPLTPGILLNGQELRRGTAAFVPAHGRTARLDGDREASLAVVHAGPGLSPCVLPLPGA